VLAHQGFKRRLDGAGALRFSTRAITGPFLAAIITMQRGYDGIFFVSSQQCFSACFRKKSLYPMDTGDSSPAHPRYPTVLAPL